MLRDIKAKEVRYNTIFHSAFKALLVFEMILESPKTLDEIRDILATFQNIKSKVSKDTLRVYINSFRVAGCKIERKLTKEKRREYSYFIPDNPFRPTVNALQTERFFNIYDTIMYNEKFETFLEFDLLTQKLDACFKDNNFHEAYQNHSLIKEFDIQLLRDLNECCKQQALVTVLYNSPHSGLKEIPIVAHNMTFQNYKLYLAGFGKEYNQEAIFLTDRIIRIVNIDSAKPEDIHLNSMNIIFELYDSNAELTEEEEIISQTGTTRIVKHRSSNKVLTTHRFLQLASTCKIIEPQSYRDYFISLLKSTAEVYADGN